MGYSRAVKRGPFIYVSGEVVLASAVASGRVCCLPHYCVREPFTGVAVEPNLNLSAGSPSCWAGTSAVDQASGRVMYRRDAYKQVLPCRAALRRAVQPLLLCM